jgi:hypothetical protein
LARVVRLVVVSPGDVMGERKRLEKVVDELNRRWRQRMDVCCRCGGGRATRILGCIWRGRRD